MLRCLIIPKSPGHIELSNITLHEANDNTNTQNRQRLIWIIVLASRASAPVIMISDLSPSPGSALAARHIIHLII